jgi:hypothetical protein
MREKYFHPHWWHACAILQFCADHAIQIEQGLGKLGASGNKPFENLFLK